MNAKYRVYQVEGSDADDGNVSLTRLSMGCDKLRDAKSSAVFSSKIRDGKGWYFVVVKEEI